MKRSEKMDREKIKKLRIKMGLNYVEELIALTKNADPYYIMANKELKAKLFRDIWEKEGWKKKYQKWEALGKPDYEGFDINEYLTHPKRLHYEILNKGYKIELGGISIPYENTKQCISTLTTGAQYARYKGYVPYDAILDRHNPEPKNIPHYKKHKEFKVKDCHISDDIIEWSLPDLIYSDIDDFIKRKISLIISELFDGVRYYSLSGQPNYLVLTSEKSGVIPINIAKHFHATIRPRKSGEISVNMCFQPVKIGMKEKKHVHIFEIDDHDAKGGDMPKSIARKVEFIAEQFEADIDVFVHHVLLTMKQCLKYKLPRNPMKIPKAGKGYITQTKKFEKWAGKGATELNALMTREPTEYKKIIREAMKPFFDENLENKFQKELKRLKDSVKTKLEEAFELRKPKIEKIRKELREKYKELRTEIEPILKEKALELGLDNLEEKYRKIINFDVKETIKKEKFKIPKAKVEDCDDALLDTRRSYLEQLKVYKDFDYRNKKKI